MGNTENNNSVHQGPSTQSQQAGVNLIEIIRIAAGRWRWFAASLGAAILVAMVMIRTSEPQYVRSTSLMVKETSSHMSASTDIDAVLSQQSFVSSKIANELVAFKSPTLMSEVVRRLGLDTEYAIRGRAHKSVVYGTTIPVTVDFSQMSIGSISKIVLEPVDSLLTACYVKRIEGSTGKSGFKMKNVGIVAFGEDFQTPAGTIRFKANPFVDLTTWNRSLLVFHRTVAATTRMFLGKLTVSPEDMKNRSDIITISIKDYNIARAEDVLKMLYVVYNENWIEDRNKAAMSASMFISDRLGGIEAELSGIDETISNFKSTNLMPDVDQAASTYIMQSTEFSQQTRQLENQLAAARYFGNFLLSSVDKTTLIPVPSGFADNGISNQVTEYNKLVLQRNGIVANSSINNPLVLDMDQNLDALYSAMIASVNNQINQIQVQMDIVSQREKQNENYIANSPNQAKTLMSYERQQKVKESLYLYLLQKREENELSKVSTVSNTKIITEPSGSNAPVSPQGTKIMLVAILLGLALPAGLLYLVTITNNTVRGRKDLAELPFPFLGEIPQRYGLGERSSSLKKFLGKDSSEKKDVDIVVEAGSRDVINEAFRVLRTNLEFICKQQEHTILLVTSYNPSSGKTFVSINLARALALNHHRVLVVDGDFRRYSMTRSLKMQHHRGFTDYLVSSETDPFKYIRSVEGFDCLDVLPLGTVPPNPSELVSTRKFADTMKLLKEKYEYVFVDCAPVDIVADTQIMAGVADRTIFVVRAGLFERDLTQELLEFGKEGKCNGITLLLNGTEVNSVYGYRYGSKYAYHYGRYGHRHTYSYSYRHGGGYRYYHYSHRAKDGYYAYDDSEHSKKKK